MAFARFGAFTKLAILFRRPRAIGVSNIGHHFTTRGPFPASVSRSQQPRSSGPRIDRPLITIVRPGHCFNIEFRVHKRTPDPRMLRLGRLGLRSFFERRPAIRHYATASCQGRFGNYLVLSSSYPDAMIDDRHVRRCIRERSKRANHADGVRPLTNASWRARHEMLGVLYGI